jgi:hypothetical protein
VKAALAGLLAGLLAAAFWLALLPSASIVRPAPVAPALTLSTIGRDGALPSAGNGTRRSTPDISATESLRAEVHAPPAPPAERSPAPAVMGGFIAGPPPRAEAAETATQRNRRFLDAVKDRVRASR